VTLAPPFLSLRLENLRPQIIMPSRLRPTSSSTRRHRRADLLLSFGTFAMRPCAFCTSRGVLCVVSALDDRCEQCMRNQRRCELAPPWEKCERLVKQSEKLQTEALKAEVKAIRLRRQRRSVLKKLKEIDARERLNIEELEIDEAAVEALEPLAEEQP
jgi:hypothetical protein